jgi:hypothetical protein
VSGTTDPVTASYRSRVELVAAVLWEPDRVQVFSGCEFQYMRLKWHTSPRLTRILFALASLNYMGLSYLDL